MQISVDGFVSTGPNDDQKWVTWAWEEIKTHVLDLIDTTDTIVLGRKLAVDYIPHWENTVKKSNDPLIELAQSIVKARKVIFSNTLQKSQWDKTEIVRGELSAEIIKLKQKDGKDMIVYGGSSFVSSLIEQNLIDEYHLYVNPVAIGKGMPIFDKLNGYRKLTLKSSHTFDCGIVLLQYVTE
jgi:dihydrofolate reductase